MKMSHRLMPASSGHSWTRVWAGGCSCSADTETQVVGSVCSGCHSVLSVYHGDNERTSLSTTINPPQSTAAVGIHLRTRFSGVFHMSTVDSATAHLCCCAHDEA